MSGAVRHAGLLRAAFLAGVVLLLEGLCLGGAIDKITMQAPHLIVRDLYRLLVSGRMNGAILKTLANALLSLVLAPGVGIIAGALLHRRRALRDVLDPLFATYYAVPVFAFYPLLIILFRPRRPAADPHRLHARRGCGDREHAQRAGPGAAVLLKTARVIAAGAGGRPRCVVTLPMPRPIC